MNNVLAMSATARRENDGYDTQFNDYYRSCRRMMDRETAHRLDADHVNYLKKRDAEILAGVAIEMGRRND